jgi:hypothetical protein
MNEKKIQNKYVIGEHLYQIQNGKMEKFEVIRIAKSDVCTNEPDYFLKLLTRHPYDIIHATEEVINKNYSKDEDYLMMQYIGRKIEKLRQEITESEQKIIELETKRKEFEY